MYLTLGDDDDAKSFGSSSRRSSGHGHFCGDESDPRMTLRRMSMTMLEGVAP
jgi:hypothetical protein